MSQIDNMLEEHVTIRMFGDRLRLMSSAPTDVLPPDRWRKLLRAELEPLGKTLVEHFKDEERGGYLSAVLEANPELSARVAGLLAEHEKLLSGFQGLLTGVNDGIAPVELASQVLEIVTALRDHEEGENDLVHESLLRDIGGSG